MAEQVSPLINRQSWKEMSVQKVKESGVMDTSNELVYRDCKVWPGGSCEWNWKVTGTQHIPGIQPVDVDELLTHDLDTLILSRGVLNFLRVPQKTVDHVLNAYPTVNVIVAGTKTAVQRYNEFASAGHRVAGLFHSTC